LPEYHTIQPNRDDYRRLVTSDALDFPGSIFYEPDFLETASQIQKLDFKPVIVMQNDRVVGLANYLIGGKRGVKVAAIPRLFQYFGPIALIDDQDIYYHLIEPLENLVDTAIFSLTPETSRNFDNKHWTMKDRLTYFLCPDTFNRLRKKCIKSARRRVNQGMNSNIIVDTIAEFPRQLYQASFNRQKAKPPIDIDTLSIWIEKLAELKLLTNYVAIVDSQPAAFITILKYGKFAYTWLSGADTKYLNIGVNNYLILKVGELLYNEGILSIDMVGGDIESIGEFKKSVGGVPAVHYQIEKDFNLKGKLYRMLMKIKAGFHG
jgi:hypothetical protein